MCACRGDDLRTEPGAQIVQSLIQRRRGRAGRLLEAHLDAPICQEDGGTETQEANPAGNVQQRQELLRRPREVWGMGRRLG